MTDACCKMRVHTEHMSEDKRSDHLVVSQEIALAWSHSPNTAKVSYTRSRYINMMLEIVYAYPEGPSTQYCRTLVPNTIPVTRNGFWDQSPYILGTWTLWTTYYSCCFPALTSWSASASSAKLLVTLLPLRFGFPTKTIPLRLHVSTIPDQSNVVPFCAVHKNPQYQKQLRWSFQLLKRQPKACTGARLLWISAFLWPPCKESVFTLDYFKEKPQPFCDLAKDLGTSVPWGSR